MMRALLDRIPVDAKTAAVARRLTPDTGAPHALWQAWTTCAWLLLLLLGCCVLLAAIVGVAIAVAYAATH